MIIRNRAALAANLVAGVLVVGVLSFGGFLSYQNVDLQHQLAASQANAQKLYQQLLDEGITPHAEKPSKVIGEPGATGATGAPGPKGDKGDTPSTEELVQAFVLYCQTYNCVGATGAAGTPGAPGESITGPAGPAGTNGADGRGITSVTCVLEPDTMTTAFRFTFTDATTTDIAAACLPS